MTRDLGLTLGEAASLMALAKFMTRSGAIMSVLTPDGMVAAERGAEKIACAMDRYVEGDDFPRIVLKEVSDDQG